MMMMIMMTYVDYSKCEYGMEMKLQTCRKGGTASPKTEIICKLASVSTDPMLKPITARTNASAGRTWQNGMTNMHSASSIVLIIRM